MTTIRELKAAAKDCSEWPDRAGAVKFESPVELVANRDSQGGYIKSGEVVCADGADIRGTYANTVHLVEGVRWLPVWMFDLKQGPGS